MALQQEDIIAKAIKKLREYYRLSGVAGQLVAEFIILTEARTIEENGKKIVELIFRFIDPYTQQVSTRRARYDAEFDVVTSIEDVK